MRRFLNKQKQERNLLEVKFIREKKSEREGANRKVDLDVVIKYLFSELKLDHADILKVDLNTGKMDIKLILFKPNIDTERIASDFPDQIGDFCIYINKISSNEKNITFKHVQSYIPDEEIQNLWAVYGEVIG